MSTASKIAVRSTEKIKVLIADDDWQSARRTNEFLNQNGFDCRLCQKGTDAKKILVGWQPKVLLVDLLLPEANAFELLQFCKEAPSLREVDIAVLVMSSHNSQENVNEAYQRGARDYLARPIAFPDLLNRVVFHCRQTRKVEPTSNAEAKTDSLKIADLIVTQALQKLSFEDMLFNFTQMSALKLKGLRCSIVHNVTHEKGIVLASNDKKDIAGLALDLKKYPEIQLVVNTGKMVVIDNLDESRALSRIKKDLKEISFNSMLVSPIYYHHKVFGVISMRMPSETTRVADIDIHFMEYIAKVLSLYVSTQSPEVIGKYGLVAVPSK
ncbi:MAG: response regulator [Bdellovibrionales bacterium]|nr:response regulator [Bdellovibrionales bacterium]